MKRKIAAILAADIAGYCKLMSEDEEDTAHRLISCRTVFEDFAGRFSGRIVDTAGDSVLAEFPSAVDAMRCAISAQESLRTHNLAYPPSRQMRWRIGVTIGDVIVREGDVMGDGVNIAARLESLAPPGGICVSHAVYEQVHSKMPVTFVDIGERVVKNIPYPVHAHTLELNPKAVTARPVPGKGETRRRNMWKWPVAVAVTLVATAVANILLSAPATMKDDFSATAVPPKRHNLPVSCDPILTACERAGFQRGGVRDGNGLFVDCVFPIIRGVPQRPNARPLPQFDPQVLAVCKRGDTNAGQAGERASPVADPSLGSNGQAPCAQIRTACGQAGFEKGAARSGNGLWKDCIAPIMQGTPRQPNASKPLPEIDPQVVAACKTKNPAFGQGKGKTPDG